MAVAVAWFGLVFFRKKMVLHPAIAYVCKCLIKITDWGSRLATRQAGNYFITLAVPGRFQTSVLLSPR